MVETQESERAREQEGERARGRESKRARGQEEGKRARGCNGKRTSRGWRAHFDFEVPVFLKPSACLPQALCLPVFLKPSACPSARLPQALVSSQALGSARSSAMAAPRRVAVLDNGAHTVKYGWADDANDDARAR